MAERDRPFTRPKSPYPIIYPSFRDREHNPVDVNGRPDSTFVPWIPDPPQQRKHFGAGTGTRPGSPSYNYTHNNFSTTSLTTASQSHSNPYLHSNASAPDSPATSSGHSSGYVEERALLRDKDGNFNGDEDGNREVLSPRRARQKLKKTVLAIMGVTTVVALVVFIPVYLGVIRPASGVRSGTSNSQGQDNNQTGDVQPEVFTRGGDGSEITMDDGTLFTYRNPFNGYWVHDPTDPFNLDARPNDWTPPLNTTWRWDRDRIFGVNLGGLFVLEPFITPAIFQRHPGAVDEYSLSALMREADANGNEGGLKELEEHYDTFITERDIADIAGAGLNWLRIPLGFWAIEKYENEPFLERTSWTYFLRVVEWARKYGLRIYLDFHAVPGGQNGMNHSGRVHQISFLNGNMGIANAQRTLYYLRILTEFISQPEYRDVILILGIVNEPLSHAIGMDALESFYLEAYRVIRGITGYGEGNGPYIAIGDGLRPPLDWEGLLPNADRVIMDLHPYVAFDAVNTASVTEVAPDEGRGGVWPGLACSRWAARTNLTKAMLGVTISGEFSSALNDCGLFIREVGVDSMHPQCGMYEDWERWSDEMKEGLESFGMASMDALGDWFFWTWKIGPALDGRVHAPFWSYKLGYEQGWIPHDPRLSVGKCRALGVPQDEPFDGIYLPWQTGGALPIQTPPISDSTSSQPQAQDLNSPPRLYSPTIPPDYTSVHPWPPTSISNADVPVSLMPTYTNTAEVMTLPVHTFTGAPAGTTQGVDGWFSDGDVEGGVGPVRGCVYPDSYEARFGVVPTTRCGG